ncbi:TetR/AcrR family transcriptional regulator [Jatrophihabitans sp.]|uniref:TetR/AcrR family transcriptional regulator n=1 Tax=Jatrophihabitans sp. TaxID=1932789 RepID=UPI0030C76B09|nr:transcriptional regulator [Jatrophihabitans sp.]
MTKPLTAKGAATRQRIVAGASAEIREHGLQTVTLEDICRRTATSKGQLFHYFPGGRDELLLAVADHEAARVLDDQQPYLGALTSWTAWQAWRDAVVARYRHQGQNCPLGVLLSEVGRQTPASRAVVTALIGQWQQQVAHGIREMQLATKIAASVDADRSAAAIVAGIQGGVSIMLSTGELNHLEAALDSAIEALRTA